MNSDAGGAPHAENIPPTVEESTVTIDEDHDEITRWTESSADELGAAHGQLNGRRPSQLVSVRVDTLQERKRKRGASPPWQFPVADESTIRTGDGRRSSARVHASASNTPGPSESDHNRHSRAASSRLSSPPWKHFGAEGPSSIQVDGVRKSGRVNTFTPPKRVSPRSKKQVDKLPPSRGSEQKRPKLDSSAHLDGLQIGKRTRKPSSVIRELEAQINELKPTKQHAQDPKRRRMSSSGSKRAAVVTPSTSPDRARKSRQSEAQKTSPRITLRLSSSRNALNPPHPQSVFPIPLHPPKPSVWQLIDEAELKEMQQPYSENERGPPSREEFERRHTKAAEQEMLLRQRILDAGAPDGALGPQRCSIYDDVTFQLEPSKQYSHRDHLSNHMAFFRSLQLKEQAAHRQLAKKLANEAVELWKKKQGPTQEDLALEANKMFRLVAKQVVADMRAKWDLVWQHVDAKRKAAWEVEQEARRQEKLKKQLAWSKLMIAKQRGQLGSELDESMHDETSLVDGMTDDELDDSDEDGDDEEEEEEESEDEDENMSDDESNSSEASLGADDSLDDEALKQYLAQRETEPPDRSRLVTESNDLKALLDGESDRKDSLHDQSDEERQVDTAHTTRTTALVADNEIELDGGLSSDESVDMDSEDYSEEVSEADSDEDDGNSDSPSDAEPSSGLLGFFSKSDREKALPTPVTSAEGEHVTERDTDHKDPFENVATPQQTPTSPAKHEAGTPPRHPALASLQSRPATPSSQAASESAIKQLVPQPMLLRGTLRSYQHAGLDWLASLYRNNTNGILADEMGLGKTIQTISLFAHIAENHNVWDPHLVIVPTSVILNWVTEFQKFLPGFRVLGYFGSGEERHAKRRFWTNDPHHENRDKRGYNVIVTSYNIALKDITSLRTVHWHYLVLDEAHNIRNFNSQRFQNLIKLKTRARLLLTGTPLQNSLTELWSLLTFLTAGRDSEDAAAHGSLEEFLARWKEPVNEIFERGVQSLSDEASKVVTQLHTSLRPFMLRRLKADVEKDLPKKTEHVVVCKLSRRQRELYQDYMGLSETRAKLTQGNAISAGKVLLSLRRVCNHPDLFDPRPIQTSYALEKSPLQQYDTLEGLVRRLLGEQRQTPSMLLVSALEDDRAYRRKRGRQASARFAIQNQIQTLEREIPEAEIDLTTISGCQMMLLIQSRRQKIARLREHIQYTDQYFNARPIYGSDLRELLTVKTTRAMSDLGRLQIITSDTTMTPAVLNKRDAAADKLLAHNTSIQESVMTVKRRAYDLHEVITRYSFCTPEVTAPVLDYLIPLRTQKILRATTAYPDGFDPSHESRTRLNIAFPDARLLVFDSGKLQRLTVLLRDLQSRGSRSLIFTQMSGTLNILEQFLGLMNLPYLRLDGSTPVERRQLYSAEFNRPDSKYQCMILSSRAGGVGLNLTGASSVIFYDLDWNPQMDRQCMDRAHRIGQVRDVEVYKMVSEKTVEENILRRANQKSLLDQTVIQEGHFTTDYDMPSQANQEDDVTAAIDRFLSGGDKTFTKTIESVEDKEDVQAAQQARKEDMQDEEDFAERSSKGASVAPTPGDADSMDMEGHIDTYMIRYLEDAVKHIPYVPPIVPTRDPGHRKKKRAR